MKPFLSRALAVAGKIFAVGCIFFVVLKLFALWDKISDFRPDRGDFFILAVLTLLMSAVTYFYCYMWGSLLASLSGEKLPFRQLAYVFAKSALGKYLPGNVMHYVSRSVLSREYDISIKISAITSFVDVLLIIASAFLLVAATLRAEIRSLISWNVGRIAVGTATLLAVVVGVPFVLKKGFFKFDKIHFCCDRKFQATMLRNTLLYSGYNVLMSLIFGVLLIVSAGGGLFPRGDGLFQLCGLYTLAWLAGYVTPGASGGIGVREVMLMTLFQDKYPQSTILIAAFLLRIMNIVSDIAAYGISVCLKSCCPRAGGNSEC